MVDCYRMHHNYRIQQVKVLQHTLVSIGGGNYYCRNHSLLLLQGLSIQIKEKME